MLPSMPTLQFHAWAGEARLAFKESTRYAVNTVCWLFAELVAVVAVYFVWRTAAANSGVGGTLSEITTYFLVGQLLHWQVAAQWALSEDIQTGALSRQLLIPRNILLRYVVSDAGSSLIPNASRWLLFAVIACFHWQDVAAPTGSAFGFALALALQGYVISNLISLSVGATTFYTQNGRGVIELVHQLRWVLGGFYFPLQQYFSLLGISLNPLAWTFYLPAAVAIGLIPLEYAKWFLVAGGVWIIILALVLRWIWLTGAQRYEAFRM